jgi:DNA recombination protein RmuC
LLEKFSKTENAEEKKYLKNEIKRCTLNKVKEVKKYIDPTLTTNFGLAAVPDAVYNLCPECQVEAFEMRVVVISYSLLVPYLLMVLQSTSSMGASYDASRIHSCIQATEDSLQMLQSELDGRFAKAMTMLTNAKDDMRVQISRAHTGIIKLQAESFADDSIIELNSSQDVAASDISGNFSHSTVQVPICPISSL